AEGGRRAGARLPEGLDGVVRLRALIAEHVLPAWAELDPGEAAGRAVQGSLWLLVRHSRFTAASPARPLSTPGRARSLPGAPRVGSAPTVDHRPRPHVVPNGPRCQPTACTNQVG